MDILVSLLLAALAYLVPKLGGKIWQEYQSRVTNYGNFQRQGNKGETIVQNGNTSTDTPSITQLELQVEIEPVPVIKETGGHSALLPPPSPLPSESKAPWAGKMDGNAVIQGVIFAEIVQPPRAYRPFVKRK